MNYQMHTPTLLLFLTVSAMAKPHPVSLLKNATADQCVECHADRAKGKFVHSAIATGCLSCHLVRVTKDTTRVTLITATPIKLCLQCHPDKDAAQIKGPVHSPAVRNCLKCHDPHTSENKNQLLKADTGATKDDNLCLGCHETGMRVSSKGSRHPALDMGCATCHAMHKTGPDPSAEFRDHLTKASPALCLDCHDVKDEKLVKAHRNQPFEKADCLSCHDPHQSQVPKLMQAYVHPAFEGDSCDTCHAPAKDGKVVLTQANKRDLCLTCHEDQGKKIASAKVQHPGAQGDCTDCHNPHAGRVPRFLEPDPVSVCLGCHPSQSDEIKKAHPHQPAAVQGCATCHNAHGGDNPKLLRAKTVNQLCLECHGPDASPVKLEQEHRAAIFDGKVRLPEDYFQKVTILPVKYGMGHPTERHPVSDVIDPKTRAVTAVTCLSCHQAHGSAKPDLLMKDQANTMDFCKTCHANGLNLNSTKTGGN